MRERRFNMDDIRRVLLYGNIFPDPEWSEVYQNWRYRVSYRDYDDEPLALIVAPRPNNSHNRYR